MNELVYKMTNIETKIRHLEQQYKYVDPFQQVGDPKVIQARAEMLTNIEALKGDVETLRKAMKILSQ